MATKPASLPVRATDATFSSGPESGNPTKIEPSAGYKTQGFVPGGNFASEYENWWGNLVYQWAAYLDDLHNSADFLNKNYTFTGDILLSGVNNGTTTTFNVGTLLTAPSANIGTVNADDINANNNIDADGAITCDGGFTTNTTAGFNIAGATSGNFNFTGTKPQRTKWFSFANAACGGSWAPHSTDPTQLQNFVPDPTEIAVIPIELPNGADLIDFGAVYFQNTGPASTDIVFELYARAHASPLTEVLVGYATPLGNPADYNNEGAQCATAAGIFPGANIVDNGAYQYFVRVKGSDAAGGANRAHFAWVLFHDPGPRNY